MVARGFCISRRPWFFANLCDERAQAVTSVSRQGFVQIIQALSGLRKFSYRVECPQGKKDQNQTSNRHHTRGIKTYQPGGDIFDRTGYRVCELFNHIIERVGPPQVTCKNITTQKPVPTEGSS